MPETLTVPDEAYAPAVPDTAYEPRIPDEAYAVDAAPAALPQPSRLNKILKSPPLRAIGTALHTAAEFVPALMEDVVNYIPGGVGPKYSHGENVAATLMQEPRPYEEGIEQMGLGVRIPFEIAKGAASFFAPMKVLGAVEKAAKIKSLLGRSLASAGVFGTGKEGVDPHAAIVGGLFPGASVVGEKLAVKIASDLAKKKLVEFGEGSFEAIKQAGRFAATQAVMEGSSLPTYLDPKIPLKEKIVLFSTNLGMNLGLHMPGALQARENLKAVRESIDQSIKDSANVIAQVGAQPMIREGRESLLKFVPEAESHMGKPLSRRLRVAGRARTEPLQEQAPLVPATPQAIVAEPPPEPIVDPKTAPAVPPPKPPKPPDTVTEAADVAPEIKPVTPVPPPVTEVAVLGPGGTTVTLEAKWIQDSKKRTAEKAAHIAANLTAAGPDGAVELRSSSANRVGDRLVITPDATKPGVWRVTHLMEDGPWGHYEFPSREAAIRAASGESGTELVKGPNYYTPKDWTVSRVSKPVRQKLIGPPPERKLLSASGLTPQEIRRNKRAIRLPGAMDPEVSKLAHKYNLSPIRWEDGLPVFGNTPEIRQILFGRFGIPNAAVREGESPFGRGRGVYTDEDRGGKKVAYVDDYQNRLNAPSGGSEPARWVTATASRIGEEMDIGKTHSEATFKLRERLGIPANDFRSDAIEYGFLDNKGNFLSREDAWQLAKTAKQIKVSDADHGQLKTSDLVKAQKLIRQSPVDPSTVKPVPPAVRAGDRIRWEPNHGESQGAVEGIASEVIYTIEGHNQKLDSMVLTPSEGAPVKVSLDRGTVIQVSEAATPQVGSKFNPNAKKQAWYLAPRKDGVEDILDFIQIEGGIKSPKQSKFAGKGDYDGYDEAFGSGAARILRREKGGQAPDSLVQAMNAHYGFNFESTSDFYDAVKAAGPARDAVPRTMRAEKATEKNTTEFFDAAFSNKGKTAKQKGKAKRHGSTLNIGDQFRIKGHLVEVVGINPDTDGPILDGGKKYGRHEMAMDSYVYPDKGSWDPVKVTKDVDFLPPEDASGTQGMLADGRFIPDKSRSTEIAFGIEGVRRLLADPNNKLSKEARDVANAWLRQPVFQKLDWSRLALSIQDSIQGGKFAGTADVLLNIVRLARESPATALPHELTHFLYELLPPAERQIVEMLRQEAIDRAVGVISTAAGGTASQRGLLEAMRPEGQRAATNVPSEFYHLQNGSEFLAHLGSVRFEREISAMKAAEGKPLRQFMLKVREFLGGLMDGIRKVLGKNPTLDRIHKDLLAGKYGERPAGTPETIGEQGMLAETKQQAERILEMAKVRGPRAERVEASEIQGQVGFPVRKIMDVALADPVFATLDPAAAGAVLKKLGHLELQDIRAEATRIVPHAEFLAARAVLPSDIWPDYSKQVGERFKLMEAKFQEVEKEYDVLFKRMNTQTYLKKVARANFQGALAAHLDLLKGHFQADVSRALAQGIKIMRAEARNIGGAETLLADLESLETKREYGEAVKSAMRDVVETLSRNEAGIALLLSVNPASAPEIVRQYSLLRNVSTPEQIVLQWASEMIARSNSTVKELVAITLLKNNQAVRDQYTAFASKFADDFAKNPFTTARRLVTNAMELGKDAERARAAFRALNKDLVRDASDLEVLGTATEIAKRMLEDPETQQYKKDVYGEVIQDRPKGTEQQAYDTIRLEDGITLPDGSNTGPITLYGDAKMMAGELSLMQQAANKIAWHIMSNPDATTTPFWQGKLDYINNVLTTSRMMTPTRFIKPGGYEGAPFSALGMSKHYVDSLGTREAARLRISLANHSRAIELVMNLLRESFPKTSLKLLAAAKSHGFDDIRNPNEAVHHWFKEIGNALYSSWQHPEGGKTVGDWIRGHQVTAEDFEMLKHTSSVTSRAFEIIQRGLPKERPGLVKPLYFKTELGKNGIPLWVQATKPSELTVTRVFNQEARDFVESWLDKKNQNQPAKLKLLTDHFWDVVQRHIGDRTNIYFEGKSPYEDAYKAITEYIDRNGLAYKDRNMDWLIDQLHQITNVPKDQLVSDFLAEFEVTMKRLPASILKKEDGSQTETLEQRNAFSAARTPQLAGDWLYNHGFRDSNALINLLMGATGHFYQRAAEDMLRVKVDLERQKRELQEKIAVWVNQGESEIASRKQAIKDQEDETKRYSPLRLEGSVDTYNELNRKLKETERIIQLFSDVYGSRGQNVDFDIGKIQRAIGAQTSSVLMSYLVAFRNLGTGWNYLGRQLNLITGQAMGGSAKGFYYVWLDAMPKYLKAAAFSTAASVGKIPAGARAAVASHRRGDPKRVQLVRFLEPMIQEMTQTMYERVKLQKELFDRGYAAPTYTVEDMLAKLSLLREGGAVREKELFSSTAGQLGFGLITLYDAMILTPFGKPFLPRFADLMLNHAAMKSSFDALEVLEQQLRKIHQNYSEIQTATGTGRFDFGDLRSPINELGPNEIFGKWYGKERFQTDKEHLKAWFEYGTIGYQDAAMRFLAELEKGNTQAKLLTPDEMFTLGNALAEETNKASAMNRTMLFKKSGLWQFVAPLLGFNLNLWSSRIRTLSRAAVDPKNSAMMIWLAAAAIPAAVSAITNAISDTTTELVARVFFKHLLGEERATRLPWEREGARSKGIGWILAMLNPEPFVAVMANSLINDMPSRASYTPSLFLLGKAADVLNYMSGAFQSGDFTFGLGRFIKGNIPISATVINKLPGVQGLVEGSNARRLLRRFGPQDLLRPPDRGITPGQAGVVTPLSPIVQRAYNAAIKGDAQGLADATADYVAKAKQLGLPNPEQRLAQALSGRDAFRSVFRVALTEDQKEAILAKMSTDQRATVENVEARIATAVQSIKGGASSRVATGTRATADDAGSSAGVRTATMRSGAGISPGIRTRRGTRSRIGGLRGRRTGLRRSRRGIARVRGYNLARRRQVRRRRLAA